MPTTPSGWYSTHTLPGHWAAPTLRLEGFIHLRRCLAWYLMPSTLVSISASLVSSAERLPKSAFSASTQASMLSSSIGLSY